MRKLVVLIIVFFSVKSFAIDASPQLLPAGVVFPEFVSAVAVDPAALPYQQGSVLQFGYSPPIFVQTTSAYEAGYAYSSGAWGVGVNFDGTQSFSGVASTATAGGGVRVGDVGLGVMMTSPIATTGLSPAFDTSIQIGSGENIQFGGVFYGFPSTGNLNISSMAFGLGHRVDGKYSLEGGVQMPFFTNLFSAGSAVTPYMAGAVFAGEFGASFSVAYAATTNTFQLEEFGVLWAASHFVNLSLLWLGAGTVASSFTAGLALFL